MKKIGLISIVGSTLLLAGGLYNTSGVKVVDENPLPLEFRSVEQGGSNHAIDTYKDGVGVFISTVEPDRAVDNKPMNTLVFKYGEAAKETGISITEQMSIEPSITAADAVLAQELGVVVSSNRVDGSSCDDSDPSTVVTEFFGGVCIEITSDGTACDDNNELTTGETFLSGQCQGGTWSNDGQSCDDQDSVTLTSYWDNGSCISDKSNGVACNDSNPDTENDKFASGICEGIWINGVECNDNNIDTINDVYANNVCKGVIPATCKEILDSGESRGNGTYQINPAGTQYAAYCDMTTDGGGWTEVVNWSKSSGGNLADLNQYTIKNEMQVYNENSTSVYFSGGTGKNIGYRLPVNIPNNGEAKLYINYFGDSMEGSGMYLWASRNSGWSGFKCISSDYANANTTLFPTACSTVTWNTSGADSTLNNTYTISAGSSVKTFNMDWFMHDNGSGDRSYLYAFKAMVR